MITYLDLIFISIIVALAQGLGMYFVLRIRKFIGRLPTILIAGDNSAWFSANMIILVAFLLMPPVSPPRPVEIVGFLYIFLIPLIGGICNVTWQGILYRSLRKKRHSS